MAYSGKVLSRLEENMRAIAENTLANAASKMWYQKITKVVESKASAEKLYFLMTGGAMQYSVEGTRNYLEQSINRIDVEPKFFSVDGLRVMRSELEDLDGAGLSKAAQWTADTTAKGALFPQRMVAEMLKANPQCFDGQTLFSSAHPVLPGDTSMGVFSNDFTGAASGDYPGAIPLTGNAASDNEAIGKAIAYIRSVVGPDGVTPLNLEVNAIVGSPSKYRALLSACKAEFVGGVAGSTDVRAQINDFGVELISAPELRGSTDVYFVCSHLGSSEVGPVIWLNRETPNISFFGPHIDAQLARQDAYEWNVRGRGVAAPGRCHLIYRGRQS